MFGDNKMINNGKCIIGSVKITVFNIRCRMLMGKIKAFIKPFNTISMPGVCRVNSVFISHIFDVVDINLAFPPNVSGYIINTSPFGRPNTILELSDVDTHKNGK